MLAIVIAEAGVLALLSLLVAGLLRSHADILARLTSPGAEPSPVSETQVGVPLPRSTSTPVHDIVGVTLDGSSVKIGLVGASQRTVLAFLSSGCLICGDFWRAFRDAGPALLPRDARLIILTKDAEHESPTKLRRLAPSDVRVVLSSSAWESYDVPVAPYFIYVDGSGVLGEGAAASWEQVMSLLGQATEDLEFLDNGNKSRRERRKAKKAKRRIERGDSRERRVDTELMTAGIYPDDPRLYHAEAPVGHQGSD